MSWPRRRRRCATSPAASLLKFGEDQNDDGFIDTRWVELEELYDNCGKQNLNRARKAYRTAEKKAADEAIVGFKIPVWWRRAVLPSLPWLSVFFLS